MSHVQKEYSRREFLKLAGMGVTAAALSGCLSGAVFAGAEENPASGKKSLIVYFSRADENYGVGYVEKGNTQKVAEQLASLTGGTLFRLETIYSYPTSYQNCTAFAKKEREAQVRPALKASVADFDQYDTIFLGYPIWWGDMPMAVYSFLESMDWNGKTIRPFCTHEGSGLSGTDRTIAAVCKGAAVQEALVLRGSTAQNDAEALLSALHGWLNL